MIVHSFLAYPVADMASAFWSSTLPGKVIVLILFMGSAAAWTIMWTKGIQLRSARRSTHLFMNAFRKKTNLLGFENKIENLHQTPLETIYTAGCKALNEELKIHGIDPKDLLNEDVSSVDHHCLNLNQLESIRSVIDRTVAEEALSLEDQMGLLATAVSAAPFLGLLGTVWGVMDAFSGMAQSGSAALSAVAPGISGALLTTIIGLIVALPSMIGYNLLSAEIRRIAVQMDNFAQEFLSNIYNYYVIERT